MQTGLIRIGIDTTNVEMVTTDDGGHIPAQYQEFVQVFSKEKAETLPQHRLIDHAINLERDQKLTWRTASLYCHLPWPQRDPVYKEK